MRPFIQTVIRTSALLAASLGAALLTARGGSKALPFDVASGGSPSSMVHKFATLHVTFHFTGTPQSFTVPQGVTHLHIIATGAAGGGNAGGPGGTTDARISVHPDQILGIFVGGKGSPQSNKNGGPGGYNGGGAGGNVRICTPKDTCWGGGGDYGGGGGSGNHCEFCVSCAYPYDGAGGGGSGFVVAGRDDGLVEIITEPQGVAPRLRTPDASCVMRPRGRRGGEE